MKFNKLIPELSVSDFEKSLEFYIRVLGFKVEYTRDESGFAFLSLAGNQIMIERAKAGAWSVGALEHPFGRGVNFQMEVASISVILGSLKKNNYPVFIEPQENWYRQNDRLVGNKEFLVQDPDGYLLRFFEDLGSNKLK